MRYFLHLAYNGTHYCGWQVQANASSVQQTINEALQKLLGHHIASMGCGRTDTGVHAKDFYMHFDAQNEIADLKDFLFRLNCVLPHDISIYRILPMHDKAHTRFDATERTYEYYVHFHKSPFIKPYSFYQGFYQIDWQQVAEATEAIKGVEDFTSLCLPSEDFKTNICYIKQAKWEILPSHHLVLKPYEEGGVSYPPLTSAISEEGILSSAGGGGSALFSGDGGGNNNQTLLRFTVTSNRFLRGMIRKIVGTVLTVGKGKISVDEFRQTVLDKKDFRIHYLAPPNGLFLSKVRYPYLD